ncbi:MAG: DUF4168 domain-containing protein [Flavipsychrobacter sp.]
MNIKRMRTRIATLLTAVALLFTTSAVMAQGGAADYTDDDIEQFVAINKETLPLQMDAQKKMMTAVQESGMDMNKFQSMAMAAQQGDQTFGGASEEEKTAFMAVATKANSIQQELGMEMQKAVSASGMDAMKFQQMAMTYQQNADFRTKIDAMMGMGEADASTDEGDEEGE